jgi:outer membrane protein
MLMQLSILFSCALLTSSATADEFKIGYVNKERILSESQLSKDAQARLESEFLVRQKDLQDLTVQIKMMADQLDKNYSALNEGDRTKRQRELVELNEDLTRKQRIYREDFLQRYKEETIKLNSRVTEIIEQISKAENYDVVFQDASYFSARVDITDKILTEINK